MRIFVCGVTTSAACWSQPGSLHGLRNGILRAQRDGSSSQVLHSFLGACSLVTTDQTIVLALLHHLQLSSWQQTAGTCTQTLCM